MDVTIKFHRTQWWSLPLETRQLISAYVGPLFPDKDDVLTMTMEESRWAEIQRSIQRAVLPSADVHSVQ